VCFSIRVTRAYSFKGIELSTRKEDDSEELHLCEAKQPSSPSTELRPASPWNIVLDSGRETTPIFHDESHKENPYAMNIPKATTLEFKEKNSTNEHENFAFMFPQDSCSHMGSPESVSLDTACFHKGQDHLSNLVYKMFRRMVVDGIFYRKHYKFRGCTAALTMQLERR
jgi:hypothetical protein